jgi:hypothetical protein
MSAPTSAVGYTSATTRRVNHERYMDMWWHGGGGILFSWCIKLLRWKISSLWLERTFRLVLRRQTLENEGNAFFVTVGDQLPSDVSRPKSKTYDLYFLKSF